eukprot:8235860-Lingulodinium_polyedra.AAC.1
MSGCPRTKTWAGPTKPADRPKVRQRILAGTNETKEPGESSTNVFTPMCPEHGQDHPHTWFARKSPKTDATNKMR